MDPISAPPSSSSFPDHWRPNIELTTKALAPHLQAAVREKVAGGTVDESAAVRAVLYEQRAAIRANAGISSEALPYHSELMQMVYDYQDLERQFDSISAQLTEQVGFRSVTDPESGKPQAVPIYRVEGARREAYLRQQEDLLRQMRLLHNEDGSPGIEGARRLKQARYESVQMLKQIAEQREDAAEVKRRAAVAIREERISKGVAAKVSMASSTF